MTNQVRIVLIGLFLSTGLVSQSISQTNNSQKFQLNSQKLDAQYAQTIKYALSEAKSCGDAISNSPHGQLVNAEVMYRNDSSPNKLDLMGSNKKLTVKQIEAVRLVANDSLKCRTQFRDLLSSVPYFSEIPGYASTQYDLIYSGLISKNITIGEANKTKAQMLLEVQNKFQAAARQLTQDLKNDAEKEIAQLVRQQNADAAQARAEELDRQQLFKNIGQSLQMMIVPPAAFYTPPQSVHCTSTKNFGTVNTNCY